MDTLQEPQKRRKKPAGAGERPFLPIEIGPGRLRHHEVAPSRKKSRKPHPLLLPVFPHPPPPRRRFPLRCVAPALGRLTCSFLLQKVVGAPQPHYSFCPVKPPPAVQPTRAEVPRCPRDGHLVLITVPPPRNRPAIEDDELTETMLFSLLPRTFSTALPIPLPLPNPPPPLPRVRLIKWVVGKRGRSKSNSTGRKISFFSGISGRQCRLFLVCLFRGRHL